MSQPGYGHGVALTVCGRGEYVGHNPKWWWLLSHLRWLYMLISKRTIGTVTMTTTNGRSVDIRMYAKRGNPRRLFR